MNKQNKKESRPIDIIDWWLPKEGDWEMSEKN